MPKLDVHDFFIVPAAPSSDPRRLKLQPEKMSQQQAASMDLQGSGAIIISNYTGFVDVLFLYYYFRPVFVRMMADKSLNILSGWEMFQLSIGHSAINQKNQTHKKFADSSRGQFSSILEVQKYSKDEHLGPVVIFPEGCKTNGAVILKWMLESLCPKTETSKSSKEFFDLMKSRCTLVGFQYDRASLYSPPHTVSGDGSDECGTHLSS